MKILVTGGVGSFGSAFVKKYHKEHEITVFSRDELKQHEMRLKYPDVHYEIGDIRDRQRIGEAIKGNDLVFHAAALKQVPSCEFFPTEAVKTNILGTDHVVDAANAHGAKVVFLSTDKAVYPINAMGISKAMAEKIAISKGGIVTRYGNVMKSRGSIIPIWEEAARNGEPLTVTNPDMTRFLLSLDDSIDLVMFAYENGNPGDVFVKKAPACTMRILAQATGELNNPRGHFVIKSIGVRHGEKMHETLVSAEEMLRTEDMGDYYRVNPDSRDMNYNQYFIEGNTTEQPEAFTSENTYRLNTIQVKELLSELGTPRD
jgi:UDP-glucose 4-epimerase